MKNVLIVLLLLFPFGLACNLSDDPEGFSTEEPEPNNENNVEECGDDELLCSDVCVDVTTEQNCGDCGVACGEAEACVDGECALQCDEGEVVCDDTCIDPQSSALFCGASDDCSGSSSGVACDADESCVDAMCQCLTEAAAFAVSEVSDTAVEGGDPVSYTIVLADQPCHPVTVSLTHDAEVTLSVEELIFSVEDWDQPQTVEVSAVVDVARDGEHTSTIEHVVTSQDPAYDGYAVDDVVVDVSDRAPVWQVAQAADGSAPDGQVYTPVVSDDGRFVAFLSTATNLTADTIDSEAGWLHVFWRDLETGETRLLSKGADGPGNGDSGGPSISSDGQIVSFVSRATNLTAEEADSGGFEVFVYTAADDSLEQISDTCSSCPNREMSALTSLSADGDRVVFTTRRQLIPAIDLTGEYTVYRYDRSTQELAVADLNADDEYNDAFWGSNSFAPRLSANGVYLGWNSAAGNVVEPDPTLQNFHSYFKNLDTKVVRRVSVIDDGQTPCRGDFRATASSSPRVADSGEFAFFSTLCPMDGSASSYDARQLYIWDDVNQQNMRITSAADGLPDGASTDFGFSSDARFALYGSRASNLELLDGPVGSTEVWQLYLYDTTTQETVAVNFGESYRWSNHGLAAATGEAQDSDSPYFAASLSRNGQFAVYATVDDMLAPESEDPMDYANVFLVRLY